jgi:hypothetical protein
MSPLQKLIDLKRAECSEVWLFRTYDDWNCQFKQTLEGNTIEVKIKDPNVESAITQVYERVHAIGRRGIPSVLPTLLEAPSRNLDDEVPF